MRAYHPLRGPVARDTGLVRGRSSVPRQFGGVLLAACKGRGPEVLARVPCP